MAEEQGNEKGRILNGMDGVGEEEEQGRGEEGKREEERRKVGRPPKVETGEREIKQSLNSESVQEEGEKKGERRGGEGQEKNGSF